MKAKKDVKPGEINSLFTLLERFPNEYVCIKHFERMRWPNGVVVSPFDPSSTVYRCKGSKYKCKKSNKYFNVKTGTIFENSNIPLQKWFMALYLFTSHKKGVSSHQLAKDIGITQKSAWFMLSRLRYALKHPDFKTPIGNGEMGIVEADECYIGGRGKFIHQSKKVRMTSELKNKVTVAGVIEREGQVRVTHVEPRKEEIEPLVVKYVVPTAKLMTDEGYFYTTMKKHFPLHFTVNHSLKQYVRANVHTNTIENFWAILKRTIYGIYHKWSAKHLQLYLEETAFRFNTRKIGSQARCDLFLSKSIGRLKYATLIAKKAI